jgi:hypothetical protein
MIIAVKERLTSKRVVDVSVAASHRFAPSAADFCRGALCTIQLPCRLKGEGRQGRQGDRATMLFYHVRESAQGVLHL